MNDKKKLVVLGVLVVALIVVAAVTFLMPRKKVAHVPKPGASVSAPARTFA